MAMSTTMKLVKLLVGLAALPALVHSFASTDTPQDGDAPQSGYLPNHNMDPSSVANNLSVAWTQTYNTNEVFYAKPLVYTPNGAPNEYVIMVSNQNIVRILDGFTGNLINSRTLDAPFASSDTNCGDIPNTVGITGTPIIDTATDIMYFFSKGYKNGQAGPQGTINGQYKFYAVQLPGLTDVAGFPVSLEGHNANNDPTRYFIGGTVLNRPGLVQFGNTIVGGFGGHCDNFNYTGMLVTVSKKGGVGVTNIQAMEASPGAPSPQTLDITIQGGGKAGIWQSGMGLAADTTNNRVFFVTGNARGAGQNGGAGGKPASGKVYLSTLEQAAVNMGVDPNTGTLTQQDYFEPYGYDSNNGGDRDFGSAGIALLDPTVFYGTGVARIAVAGGKDGNVYVMNADNLGGFAGGSAGADAVIQTIVMGTSILSGPASYPLEGGYIYLAPSGDSLYCYSFSRDGNGNPKFTLAGKSAVTFAGQSVPTITTNNGAPGTGIVWLSDNNKGLVAYNAVPVNGVLTPITLPTGAATGGLTKNHRAVFGDGRVYVSTHATVKGLSGGGQKTKPALTCAPNPVAFGSVQVSSISTIQVTCTAAVAVTKPKCGITSPFFQCGAATFPASVASGGTFTFPVLFNLSNEALQSYEDTSSTGPLSPGAQASTLNVGATAPSGYLQNTVIPLTGTAAASGGYLTINQTSASFGGVYIGGQSPSSSSRSVILMNKGSKTLTFTGFAWQDYYAPGQPYTNVTSTVVGNGYTSSKFPTVGSTLAAGASLTIPLVFQPSQTGISASYLKFWSDGGYTDLLMQGTATQGSATSSSSSSTSSSAKFNSTTTTTIIPTTSSTKISSTVSSSSSIKLTSSSSVLSSTTSISSTKVTTSITPSGTLNPLEPATISTFQYIGCYKDNVNNVRTLNASTYTNAAMTLEMCATQCTNYDFFGTEYYTQCYCGYTLDPSTRATESDCKDNCGGNSTELCGAGNRLSVYQNSIYYPPPAAPVHVQTASGYVWQGCYTEGTAARALTGPNFVSSSMTVESCIASCAGYTYAGIEDASECYCGNTLSAGSALTTTGCSMLCSGSSSEYCGGGSKLDMYMYNPAAASSLSSTVVSSTTKVSSSSSKPASTSSAAPSSFTTSTISASSAKASSSSTSSSALPYVTPPAPALRSFTWSIGWVSASPDGYKRPFIGINGQWPCPAITVNMGDTVKITVTNNLVNETTAIHFHGLHQRNTTYADGPAMVTQCPIQPGGSFVYEFKVTQSGTYWYHAHIGGQYIDGFRGPFIAKDVNAPYRVDTEYILTLSDLYHSQAPPLINYYQSVDNAYNNNGAEPVPNSILINEAQNVQFAMVPGKKYLFRVINMGAFAPQYLQFDQHDMTVVEIDGVYTQPYTVSQLFVTAAQRYSVIITAKATSSKNFAIKSSMYTDMFNPSVIPTVYNTEVSAYLIYNSALALPAPLTITPAPFDDSVFVPYDQQPALGPPDVQIYMTVSFGANENGQWRGFLNGIDYVPQKVPTLYTALNAPANLVNNPAIYGQNTNPNVLPYGSIVELTVSNHDSFAHPFHLHAHNFQVISRDPGGANFPINIPAGAPMRRDTVQMMAEGSITIRFVADNPGITLFHCHIEWHVEAGLTATFIEAPTELQASKPYIPVSHKNVCSAQGIAMKGNAAGNTKDYTNLAGQNTVASNNSWGSLISPPTTPAGPYPLT